MRRRLARTLRDVPPPPRKAGFLDGAAAHLPEIAAWAGLSALSAAILAVVSAVNGSFPPCPDLRLSLTEQISVGGTISASESVRFPFAPPGTRRIRFTYTKGDVSYEGVSYTSDPSVISKYPPGAMCPVVLDAENPRLAALESARPCPYPWWVPAGAAVALAAGAVLLALAVRSARATVAVLRGGAATTGTALVCRIGGGRFLSRIFRRVTIQYSFEDLSGRIVRGKFTFRGAEVSNLPAPGAQVAVLYDEGRPHLNALWAEETGPPPA
ncbi:MAG: hypothetical protein N3A38_11765 [Planctomycetota bacterium]|nr:hypothetical protein [Planctomycetota bacterium]